MVAFAKDYLPAESPARSQNRAESFFGRAPGRAGYGAPAARFHAMENSCCRYDTCQGASLAQSRQLEEYRATAAELGWTGFETQLTVDQQIVYGHYAADILAFEAAGGDAMHMWEALLGEVPFVITDSSGLVMSDPATAARDSFLNGRAEAGLVCCFKNKIDK